MEKVAKKRTESGERRSFFYCLAPFGIHKRDDREFDEGSSRGRSIQKMLKLKERLFFSALTFRFFIARCYYECNYDNRVMNYTGLGFRVFKTIRKRNDSGSAVEISRNRGNKFSFFVRRCFVFWNSATWKFCRPREFSATVKLKNVDGRGTDIFLVVQTVSRVFSYKFFIRIEENFMYI